MADILVYALHYEGAINKNSLGAVSEAAGLASQIGGEAHAVVVGEGVSDDLAASLGNYGVTKVFRAEAPEGLAQPVVDVMAKIMSEQGHQYAVFGGGLLGFEIGAGLAARLGAGVTMEVTQVNVVDGKLAAGRGLGKAEGFELCDELAKAFGGNSAVAATRAVVDAGWYPYAAQIGQTGKTVSPKLYLAAGISGAIQHKVGMQSSENIVAINKDANAPIFEFSDLGIVGDLNKILPKLTEAIKAKKGG